MTSLTDVNKDTPSGVVPSTKPNKKRVLLLITFLLISVTGPVVIIVMVKRGMGGNGSGGSATSLQATLSTTQIHSVTHSTNSTATIQIPSTIATSRTSATTIVTTPVTSTLPLPNAIQLNTNDIFGLYETLAGNNGSVSSAGFNVYQYPAIESPPQAIDNNVTTKFTSYGTCNYSSEIIGPDCGLRTGLYVSAMTSGSQVTGLQLCTGNDYPDRDPITVTLEGSNQDSSLLLLGSSWTLMYNGTTGLDVDPGRLTCALSVNISNTVAYQSYRFLVTAKRGLSNCVQYSEIRLIGT